MANSSVNETDIESNGMHDYDQENGYFSSSFILPCSEGFPYHCSVAIGALCIALVGIVGNLTVIGSMFREKLYKKTSHMSILVLAVTDILCLLVFSVREFIYFPNEFYFIKNYAFPDALCVVIFVINNTPYLSSCWNVMFLAYERYVLVTNPFVYMDTHTPTIVVIRAVVTFVLIGLLNMGYAIIMVNLSQCPDFILIPVYYGFVTVPIIGISLFSLVFFHCSKVYKLKKLSNNEGRHSQKTTQFPHMTRIVYTIVIIFILSQIPYLIFDVISIYESFDNNIWPMEYYDVILNIGIVAFLTNYSSNPFIYWLTPVGFKCKRRSSGKSRETSSALQTKTSIAP